MSEILPPDLSKAEHFYKTHVVLSSDYETYCRETIEEWKDTVEQAAVRGESVRPLWLRRTDDMGSEFGAVIDYILPFPSDTACYATIHIDSDGGASDISVYLPSSENSDEPILTSSEAYTLPALQRAIDFVEARVNQ